ncbi:MAG TPA: hypothetical protein DCS93_04085 [Microscillaceae bacterium]|nr:hypothetical protein [Microscillaceae bacterium]
MFKHISAIAFKDVYQLVQERKTSPNLFSIYFKQAFDKNRMLVLFSEIGHFRILATLASIYRWINFFFINCTGN